jgi:transposase InsO family protein
MEAAWQPERSGGRQHKEPSQEVEQLWRKLLGSKPPGSYSFIASESLRRHGVAVDRATVRRWALRKGVVQPPRPARDRASVRRWQCESVGALWQLDVSPHAWFGPQTDRLPLFDILDDCSRVITGTRLYPRECLLAYLDFLRRVFEEYGLPACLYVDRHSFFFTALPEMLTYLGRVLQWLGITFKYAPTAQAKGKIERQHLSWQNRLPAYFVAEQIRRIEEGNVHIDSLRLHHNEAEIHRELGMTPNTAWRRAIQEKRSVLRPPPVTPWWSYLWTVRNTVRASLDGTVSVGMGSVKIPSSIGRRLTLCEHPDGSFTLLANEFGVGKPLVIRRVEVSQPTWRV